MVMRAATASSRATVTGRPLLFGPSPEMSMTRRVPSKPLPLNRGVAKSMASLIDVQGLVITGTRAIADAKVRALAPSWIRAQSAMTWAWREPAHST